MKRLLPALLFLFALLLPAMASGQSQVLLQATEEDGTVCSDVSLGSYTADTIRAAAETDFALLPSGLLGLNLQPGQITEETLALSFPRDETVYAVTLTPAKLKELLEIAASTLVLDEVESLDREASSWPGFLQVSGLRLIYDVPAEVGDRVYEAKLDDDTELDFTDGTALYTAAVPSSLLDGTYGYPILTPDREVGSLRELVGRRVAAEGITRAPDARRIILYGARQNEIVDYFNPVIIILVIVVFAFFGGHKWRRLFNFER